MAHLALGADEIHVWWVLVELTPSKVAELTRILSQDEVERAASYAFGEHRRRFVVGRALLRTILGWYMGLEPGELRFVYGRNGKPALAASQEGRLQFSVAHSGELAAFAVALGAPLGLDIEVLRSLADADSLAERILSVAERTRFRRVSPDGRGRALFNAWTRKEAYVKATGEGIVGPLERIEVSLAPGEPARLLRLDGDSDAASRWTLYHLQPSAECVGALAAPARAWRITMSALPCGGQASRPPRGLAITVRR